VLLTNLDFIVLRRADGAAVTNDPRAAEPAEADEADDPDTFRTKVWVGVGRCGLASLSPGMARNKSHATEVL